MECNLHYRISIQNIFKVFSWILSTDIIDCKAHLNKNELCCQRYIRMIVVVGLYQLEFLSQVKLHAIYVMNFILLSQ